MIDSIPTYRIVREANEHFVCRYSVYGPGNVIWPGGPHLEYTATLWGARRVIRKKIRERARKSWTVEAYDTDGNRVANDD